VSCMLAPSLLFYLALGHDGSLLWFCAGIPVCAGMIVGALPLCDDPCIPALCLGLVSRRETLSAERQNESAFVDGVFHDLLGLLEDTRSWITDSDQQKKESASLPPEARIGLTRDLSTLTSRATAAMSVVLLYKALDEDASQIKDPGGQLDELYAEVARGVGSPGKTTTPKLADLMVRAQDVLGSVSEVRRMILSQINAPRH